MKNGRFCSIQVKLGSLFDLVDFGFLLLHFLFVVAFVLHFEFHEFLGLLVSLLSHVPELLGLVQEVNVVLQLVPIQNFESFHLVFKGALVLFGLHFGLVFD